MTTLMATTETVFDPLDESTWSKPFKACFLWRVYGRSGLTVHAIASLTELTPTEVIEDLKKYASYYGGNRCDTVKAIVWWNIYRTDRVLAKWWAEKVTPIAGTAHLDIPLDYALGELQKWPWPQYKGIHHGEGLTSGPVLVDNPLMEKNIRKYVHGIYATVTEARANLGKETEDKPGCAA